MPRKQSTSVPKKGSQAKVPRPAFWSYSKMNPETITIQPLSKSTDFINAYKQICTSAKIVPHPSLVGYIKLSEETKKQSKGQIQTSEECSKRISELLKCLKPWEKTWVEQVLAARPCTYIPQVQKIELKGYIIDDITASALGYSLGVSRNILSLTLIDTHISDEGLKNVLDGIKRSGSLMVLKFCMERKPNSLILPEIQAEQNQLPKPSETSILGTLLNLGCPQLRTLHLENCGLITKNDIAILCELLSTNKFPPTDLVLRDCDILEESIFDICSALSPFKLPILNSTTFEPLPNQKVIPVYCNRTLKSLDLSGQRISPKMLFLFLSFTLGTLSLVEIPSLANSNLFHIVTYEEMISIYLRRMKYLTSFPDITNELEKVIVVDNPTITKNQGRGQGKKRQDETKPLSTITSDNKCKEILGAPLKFPHILRSECLLTQESSLSGEARIYKVGLNRTLEFLTLDRCFCVEDEELIYSVLSFFLNQMETAPQQATLLSLRLSLLGGKTWNEKIQSLIQEIHERCFHIPEAIKISTQTTGAKRITSAQKLGRVQKNDS